MLESILDDLYRVRYSESDEEVKQKIWEVLCKDFLQQYVAYSDTVMDIAAGHCEFINNIKCRKKYAIDIDERIKRYAGNDVTLYVTSAESLPAELENSMDVVFMACFFEHLPSKDSIIKVLLQVKKVLKKGGIIMILNPNFRFSTSDYWDYFDHLTAVSDRSMVEVLKALGFEIDTCLPRFVPNTIKDRLPKSAMLVKIYLKLPFLFPIFGKQMFIVARNN